MLICGYLNTFPNTFWGMVFGISNIKYQICYIKLKETKNAIIKP